MSDKNLNIENNSINNILNRTSYNVRQEINANVIGVLKYNNEIRKKLLNRNIGKYNMFNLNEGIGYISNFYLNELRKPLSLGEDGLLGYTHIYNSDFQENINKKYNIGNHIQYYQHGSLPDKDNLKWNGNYENYIEYINNIFNLPITANELYTNLFKTDKLKNENYSPEESQTIQTIINDFIQYDNIKYAMETTRIGSINPNPLAALSGAVTTNISNFSGIDTRLGLLTNQLYAHTLRKGAQFNTIRKTPYITPEIYNTIGNKLSTVSNLDSDYRFDDENGRIIDFNTIETSRIIGDGVDIVDFDVVLNDINSLNIGLKSKNYLIENLKRNTNSYNTEEEYIVTETTGRGKNKKTEEKSIKQTVKKYTLKNYFNLKDVLKSIDNTGWSELDNEFPDDIPNDSIIYKTKELFNNKKINTLVSRFFDDKNKENNILQSAVDSIYGISHGRNLLSSKSKENTNGYNNPYCRVWTKNYQYDNVSKLISSRQIDNESEKIIEQFGRRENSVDRLKDYSVRNSNGFINITPLGWKGYDIKRCMFSIENLAWKDVSSSDNLSKEQIGPNGGRIMWFPPYNLSFNENISTNWNSNDFIGRGEKIYTYINTERTGTLSFDLLVDYPSILDMWKENGDGLTKDNNKDEQTLLRFFAGDENLKLRNYEREVSDNENIIQNAQSLLEETRKDDFDQKTIKTTIFFPRYYSGINESNPENALSYLFENYEKFSNIFSEYEKLETTPIYEGLLWNHRVDNIYKDKKEYNDDLYYNKFDDGFNRKEREGKISFYEFYKNFDEKFKKIKISKVNLLGSVCGRFEIDEELGKNRCEVIKKFLCNKLDINNNIFTCESKSINDETEAIDSPNAKEYKERRYVDIEIIYTDNEEIQKDLNKTIRKAKDDIVKIDTLKKITETKRWDKEAQYFQLLGKNDSFTYSKIIEKVKYFTPAFHSITPEGFNARLSFLHQCSRQGQTFNSSDNKGLKSAGNLSFGRPPICVLRIGDFFNTKIVINSITINYDSNGPVQWDMNQEGIGIQPMMAKISLNFVFLGGSDLTGPISRLQNAVSFNYYANQSIYDNRADIAQIENKKSKIMGTPWVPQPKTNSQSEESNFNKTPIKLDVLNFNSNGDDISTDFE